MLRASRSARGLRRPPFPCGVESSARGKLLHIGAAHFSSIAFRVLRLPTGALTNCIVCRSIDTTSTFAIRILAVVVKLLRAGVKVAIRSVTRVMTSWKKLQESRDRPTGTPRYLADSATATPRQPHRVRVSSSSSAGGDGWTTTVLDMLTEAPVALEYVSTCFHALVRSASQWPG